ncbi:alpha/beta hydrolase [Ostreibacterium oceani]|uniref:Carboxylesterase n=1 Tax=Ostreibacterium oceani TaxID=2654998 RepID=A0A6N7EZJ3_9GAMM|nr:alpha/beta hydrolase-fold protein [Ostreibacterium oceani]MPV85928.1 carboxylesterase [Ostreibacterium oceani]
MTIIDKPSNQHDNNSPTPALDTTKIIEPPTPARAAIIWLHGLGADANDFTGIVSYLPIKDYAIRMVFPNAPKRAVTINQGMIMQAWYDITDITLRDADIEGICASQQQINRLIDAQIEAGIPCDKIVLGGFSQGGAMSLYTGLRYAKRLAGVVCFSGYLLTPAVHASQCSDANQATPIWMAHGQYDQVVALQLAKSSATTLRNTHPQINMREYAMGHEVIAPEIADFTRWLHEVLA